MRLLVAVSGVLLWVGLTLLLSELRWFAREPLRERLRPYVPGGMGARGQAGLLSVESFREAVGPLARTVGERVARVLGVGEDLERRLRRIHVDLDATAFRVRQVGWSLAGFGVGMLLSIAVRPPLPIVLLLVVGGTLLGFLVLEQRMAAASDAWKRSLFLELPIVAEQLGMLLGAGYSVMAALHRISERGRGSCARDLRRVLGRIRQGLTEEQALLEWAELSDVPAVERFVSVLALNQEASDLGRMISEEARAIRLEVQRELVETMERRAQQVWIPVTVATLLPGVIFIAVPFVQALEFFAA